MAKKEQKKEYYILSCVGMSDSKPKEKILNYDEIEDKIAKDKLKKWNEVISEYNYKEKAKETHFYDKYEPAVGPVCGLILERYETQAEIKKKIQLLEGIEKYFLLVNSISNNDRNSYDNIINVLEGCQTKTRGRYKLKEKITEIEYDNKSEDTNDIKSFFDSAYIALKKQFDIDLKSESEKILLIYTNPGTTSMAYGLMNLYTKGLFQNYFSKTLLVTRKDFSNERSEENILRITDVYNLGRLDSEIKINSGMVDPENLQTETYKEISHIIKKAARLNIPVLLYGERGTGKSTFANYYHKCRQEKGQVENNKDMVIRVLSEYGDKENMRDILFGWEKNAFTGAVDAYPGLLGLADNSTLFLDEIHHLTPDLQSTLLRPLNDGTYRVRKGEEKKVSFGLVVATNDIDKYNNLNDDFRDRIERIRIDLPTTKDIDIEDKILFFEKIFLQNLERSGLAGFECFDKLTEDCQNVLIDFFKSYDFPGNLRDMKKLSDYIILECSNFAETHIELDKEKLEKVIIEIKEYKIKRLK